MATNQTVRFGDFVSLRRTSNAVPATAGGGGTAPPRRRQQAKTVPAGVGVQAPVDLGRKRVVSVPVACARASRLCQGAVYVVYAKRTLAHRSFLIAGGKTTRLHVTVSRRQFRRLGKKSRRVRVNLFSRDGNGVASTSSRIVTLAQGR